MAIPTFYKRGAQDEPARPKERVWRTIDGMDDQAGREVTEPLRGGFIRAVLPCHQRGRRVGLNTTRWEAL